MHIKLHRELGASIPSMLLIYEHQKEQEIWQLRSQKVLTLTTADATLNPHSLPSSTSFTL